MRESKNISLNYETLGDKQHSAVLLIHGLFGDLDNLKSISRALSDHYFVINIDVRNHGQSPWVETMSFPEMSDDILGLLESLDIERTFILGHSMGGKIAMDFALEHSDKVHGLVIADIAPVAYEARHTTIIDALKAVDFNRVSNRSDVDHQLEKDIKEKGVRQFLMKNLKKEDNSWSWRMNLSAIEENYPSLIGAPASKGTFEGPVLFIRGGDSDYVQASHREEILSRFPKAESKTIEGVGHWLHAEKPTVFNKIVVRFLDENR
ncbi:MULTISPECIES: alpha/beta fold hydrolase [Gammaproteobacteria]|uniref:alpha/beta fold hydrolase n=1 Tax=Gammaproteobacteria TaxID=1236 RepID=UPI000DD05CB3|nr:MULTISPECIES: alpha/beta fold hydrolase [Gammaproteobacteria]RTE87028.1 alpha/beta fold hydrolase [Aliidiomarina sp. B3213]TCZ93182.1 alpha/beta fold hydrolase [Lysobacter sp. N42]